MSTLRQIANRNKRLLAQETLILECAERLALAIEESGKTRAEIAREIGKSKAFVTQCLRGQNNLTLRTIADLFSAMQMRVCVDAIPTLDEWAEDRGEVVPFTPRVARYSFEDQSAPLQAKEGIAA